MKNLVVLIFFLFSSLLSGQINGFLNNGSKALKEFNYDLAKTNYLKAYDLDKLSYEANFGVGYVLSEFQFKYVEAIPFLETACKLGQPDTITELMYALAKSYQYINEFEKSKTLYQSLLSKANQEINKDTFYIADLKKRTEDCVFASSNKNNLIDKTVFVGNLGKKINSDMPEYMPIISNENLLFTSRRKYLDKGKKEGGSYFEKPFSSPVVNGIPQSPKAYVFSKQIFSQETTDGDLSILSSSPDGKKMFVFQKNKIFEINLSSKKLATDIEENIKMNYVVNYATQSIDGKTLFFSSDDKRGIGGLDIYKSTKQADGTWGVPENVGAKINTEFDEEAPFLSEDGKTLFFSSKGHQGFGNFDIYKSTYENGSWSSPENLKQPINSSANDIFYTQHNQNDYAYFSSDRITGYGDMDIYKITYMDKFNIPCSEKTNSSLSIASNLIDKTANLVKFEIVVPENLHPINYHWTFNQVNLPSHESLISQVVTGNAQGDAVSVKIFTACDTCIAPSVLCSYTKYILPKSEIVVTHDIGKNPYDSNLKLNYLTQSKITELGFDLTPIKFRVNDSKISETDFSFIEKNSKILKEHPELSILIYGFTDSRGSNEHNLVLSKKRAQEFKKLLISKGIKSNQIDQVFGKGEEFLLFICIDGAECDDVAHQASRRVEFIIFERK